MKDIDYLYKDIFTPQGTVKNVGREACKRLIEACNSYYFDKYKDFADFGDVESGFMNVENIQKFVFSHFEKIN